MKGYVISSTNCIIIRGIKMGKMSEENREKLMWNYTKGYFAVAVATITVLLMERFHRVAEDVRDIKDKR